MRYFIIILLFIINTTLKAQPEKVYLQTDKDFYVVGEDLWYNILFLNKDTSEIQSAIVHLDIVNPKGVIVKHQRLKINQRQANGDFTIPLTWAEGFYTIRVYTRWNLNYEEAVIFQKKIPIYNILEEEHLTNTVKYINKPNELISLTSNSDLKIELQLEKKTFQKREKSKVTLTVKGGNIANCSAKIIEADIPKGNSQNLIEYQNQYKRSFSKIKETYTPQAALSLKGMVYDKNQKSEVGVLSVFMNEEQFKAYVPSTINTGFETTIPPFYGLRTFQFNDMNPWGVKEPSIQLDALSSNLPTSEDKGKLTRSPKMKSYLQNHKKRTKIKQLFGIQSFHAEKMIPINNQFVPDKEAILAEYVAMADLEEFIGEVFTFAIKIRKKKKQKTIRVLNLTDRYYFPAAPMFLVDGFITYDEASILKIPLTDIEKIELFATEKTLLEQFGYMGKYGVISLTTKSKKAMPEIRTGKNIKVIEGLYLPRDFQSPNYEKCGERVPDFRPVVYWNPTVKLEEEGQATFEFVNADVIGQFILHVEGMTVEGDIFIEEVLFEVK